MNELVIIGIVIAAIAIIWWSRRGIAALIYGITSWIFIIIFVVSVNPVVFDYIYSNKDIHDYVYEAVFPHIDESIPDIDEDTIELPDKYKETLKLLDSLGIELKYDAENAEDEVSKTADDIRDNAVKKTAEKLTEYILRAAAIVIVFVIAKLLSVLIKIPLKIVLKFFKISY